jgi:hypothetical protein
MKGIGWQEVCSADAFCISEMETKDIMTSNAEKCNAICLKKEISTRLPPEGIFETQSEWLLMAHDTPGICLGAIPSQCPLVELGTEFLCLVIVWTLSVPFKGTGMVGRQVPGPLPLPWTGPETVLLPGSGAGVSALSTYWVLGGQP